MGEYHWRTATNVNTVLPEAYKSAKALYSEPCCATAWREIFFWNFKKLADCFWSQKDKMSRLSYVLFEGFFMLAIHDEFIFHNGKYFVVVKFTMEWSYYLPCILYSWCLSLNTYIWLSLCNRVCRKFFGQSGIRRNSFILLLVCFL